MSLAGWRRFPRRIHVPSKHTHQGINSLFLHRMHAPSSRQDINNLSGRLHMHSKHHSYGSQHIHNRRHMRSHSSQTTPTPSQPSATQTE